LRYASPFHDCVAKIPVFATVRGSPACDSSESPLNAGPYALSTRSQYKISISPLVMPAVFKPASTFFCGFRLNGHERGGVHPYQMKSPLPPFVKGGERSTSPFIKGGLRGIFIVKTAGMTNPVMNTLMYGVVLRVENFILPDRHPGATGLTSRLNAAPAEKSRSPDICPAEFSEFDAIALCPVLPVKITLTA